jgi:hypothetical protein
MIAAFALTAEAARTATVAMKDSRASATAAFK